MHGAAYKCLSVMCGNWLSDATGRSLRETRGVEMEVHLRNLPVGDRIKLVEDLWDSIAADQSVLQLTTAQRAELDQRLDAYELDGDLGWPVDEVIAEIRRAL